MIIKTTLKIVIDSKSLTNNKYAVYLRIIKNRKVKKISLGLHCDKRHFDNELFTKQHPNYLIENELLLKIRAKATEIIRKHQIEDKDFSLEEFESEFRGAFKNIDFSITNFFNEIIEEMTRSGRIGNAKAYKDTLDSLIKFGGKKIRFQDITPTFLEKYEVFLKENGNNNGGIAFKMRELRSLFNKARKRKIIPKDLYPFEEYKISKLKSTTNKRAMTLEEFQKIKRVDLSNHPHLVEAYNYFLFSVYARGMNFHDMMLLKWENIRSGRIYYTRSKTKGKINLEIIPPLQEIIDFYKAQHRKTPYVLPILLQEGLNPVQIANRKHKVLSRYNKKIKEIARLAGVYINLSSYVARHSFATILKMAGTPIEKISEMMGHKDVSITIAYLKEFLDEDLDQENRKFIDM